ncbi:MAG: DHH family phosphoesterase [Candidatus Helarchaeota archaeon]
MSKLSFFKKGKELSSRLNFWERSSKVMIIGHRDGDGMSAASVLLQGLKQLGFRKIVTQIMLSPDLEILESILQEDSPKYVITCDIGADFAPILETNVSDYIITDHHPNKNGKYGEKQLNCIEFGFDDESDASGSILAFCLLMPLFDNVFWETETGRVMLAYAISGAISDFQFQKKIGEINRIILDMAKISGAVKVKKDISVFGRGTYPAFVAISRACIPGISDYYLCRDLINSVIETKDGELWRRIIDLTQEEKQAILNLIINRLISVSNKIDIKGFLQKEVVSEVYDLEALRGWDCTRIPDGRYTLDPREILHKINYCCRQGYWNLALQLLNEKKIPEDIYEKIEVLHKMGDQEVANALSAYNEGILPIKTANDGKVVWIDFSDYIFYDEVGVVAGVIMKQARDIEIILSSCKMDENGNYKVSVRAREKVWEMIDEDNEFADAKKVYKRTKIETNEEIKYGGHRFAMSGYMPKKIIPVLFQNMVEYRNKMN